MGKKKDYCTQNNGDCKTCSLVNYGRDCKNNPIEAVKSLTRRPYSRLSVAGHSRV